ncbi:hypothetical protein [Pseudoalteromonas sp. H105]|uniref:hypothetical protein n=1 Tax=Pseudoalteromonas sp. H105 TaxID=1348393 RepID=UPI0007322749|nr:hypothetical protein [Pseudoalteromonas sp. H105]KTF13792.1 hypothetical protein ATS75_14605 [Pseudoalteromonas sp. H105]
MKKISLLLMILLAGCSPSETQTLQATYSEAKLHGDIVTLSQVLAKLADINPEDWKEEHSSVLQAHEYYIRAKKSLDEGNLNEAITHANKSFLLSESQQVLTLVKQIKQELKDFQKAKNVWITFDQQLDELNNRINDFSLVATRDWSIINFNQLLVELIDFRKQFLRAKLKIEESQRKTQLHAQTLAKINQQLVILEACINSLLGKVVSSAGNELYVFTNTISEQTISHLTYFSDDSVPGMVGPFYKKFLVKYRPYYELVENTHFVTYQNDFSAFMDLDTFTQLQSKLVFQPKDYENYKSDIKKHLNQLSDNIKNAKLVYKDDQMLISTSSSLLTSLDMYLKPFSG